MWLGRLAELVALLGDNATAEALWCAMGDELIAGGMSSRQASAIALRRVKLGAMLLAGSEQREAAVALGISERTAKYDAQRLRHVVESGDLELRPVGSSPRLQRPRRPR